MITIGLVKELFFIAAFTKREVNVEFELANDGFGHAPLKVIVKPNGEMDTWYCGNHIWNETVEGEDSFFGVESCDSISRIVSCIDNGDPFWKENYYFNEKEKKIS